MTRLLTLTTLAFLAACSDPDCPAGSELNESKSRCIPIDAGVDAASGDMDGGMGDGGDVDGGNSDGGEPTDAGSDSGMGCLGYTDAGACICNWRDGTACPEGTWCHPDASGDRGVCVEEGDALEEAICSEALAPVCRQGLVCLSVTAAAPVCRKVCDPDEVPSTVCEPHECHAFAISGVGEPDYGVCDIGCDFDEGESCEDTTRLCAAGELLGYGEDVCVPGSELGSGADCEATGLGEGNICGGLAGCVRQTDDSILCTEFCRPSKGTYGVAGHPDCSDAGDVCTEYMDWGIGTCG